MGLRPWTVAFWDDTWCNHVILWQGQQCGQMMVPASPMKSEKNPILTKSRQRICRHFVMSTHETAPSAQGIRMFHKISARIYQQYQAITGKHKKLSRFTESRVIFIASQIIFSHWPLRFQLRNNACGLQLRQMEISWTCITFPWRYL